MIEDTEQRGIQAAQAGDRALAQKLLMEAVRQNPRSAQAWFWLGNVLDDAEKKKYCHERALQLDLALIERAAADQPPAPPSAQAAAPVQSAELPPAQSTAAPAPVEAQAAGPETLEPPPEARKLSPLALAGLIGVCLLLVAAIVAGLSWVVRGGGPLPVFRPPAQQETQTYERLGFQVTAARDALDMQQHEDCIQYYDDLLRQMPYWHVGYYNRGVCKRMAAESTTYLNEYEQHLKDAIKDQDRALALQPDYSNAYMERAFDYVNLRNTLETTAEQKVVLDIADDNLQAALALGSTHPSVQINRVAIPVLSGRCAEGLDEGYSQIDSTLPGRDRALLYHWLAIGHLCLGENEDALAAIETSRDMGDTTGVIQVHTSVLIGLGDLERAFDLIDASIQRKADFGGYRYYQRALIYYEWGNDDLARQDLAMGSGNTWFHGGLYAYLIGMLELQDGNEREARKWIEEAAATFTPDEGLWLKERIDEQLNQLGIKYRAPQPKIWVTPIPDPTEQP